MLQITQDFTSLCFTTLLGQVLINLVMNRIISSVITLLTIIIIPFGLIRWTNKSGSMMEVAQENIEQIIYFVICEVAVFMLTFFMFRMNQYDFLMAVNKADMLQGEFKRVMENLDEAIICQSKHGITFCNSVGLRILQNIQSILQHVDEIQDTANRSKSIYDSHEQLRPLYENLIENRFPFSKQQKKTKSQRKIEKQILEAKIFELKENLQLPMERDNNENGNVSTNRNRSSTSIGGKKKKVFQ